MASLLTEQLLDERQLATDLAGLGYPGLPPLQLPQNKKNPSELLLTALSMTDLDIRLIEALPWIVWCFPDLDWASVTNAARQKGLQNKLGFIVNLARRLAPARGEQEKAARLASIEAQLENIRLLQEETLCHDSLTTAERRWLQTHRTPEARHWQVLTALAPEDLHDVA